MLPLLQWLDRNPAIYALCFALVALAVTIAVSASKGASRRGKTFQRWALPALLFALLLAGRWPQLLAVGELNPDASQFLAGAITLQHDPVFWRSVDGMTAGPLNYYMLAILGWLGIPLTYAASRVVSLGLLALTFTFSHRLIAAHHGSRAAALAVMPATLFFALTTDPDFNHYSSEMVPIALIALAAMLLFHSRHRHQLSWIAAGTFTAGLVPWAKLQAAPLAAALGLFALVHLAGDRARPRATRVRRVALAFGAALLPSLLILGMVGAAHSFGDFFQSYIVQNLLYTDPSQHRLLGTDSRFFRADFSVLGYVTVCLLALAWTAAALHRGRKQPTGIGPLLPVGAILLILGLFCVAAPGHDFLHYTLLLLPGALLLSGAGVGECERTGRRGVATALGIAAVACVMLLRVQEPLPANLGRLARDHQLPASSLSRVVGLFTGADRQVAIWGWEMQLYVDASLRQATRSAYSYWETVPGPLQDYFRQRYVEDLERNRPPVFVDAVGNATRFFRGRARLAHENFPALRTFVAENYFLVADLQSARVYARRDLLAQGGPTQKEIDEAMRLGRGVDYLETPEPVNLARFDLPREMVGRRFSLVMRPPASILVPLVGLERELRIGYGYLPEAELQNSGNGTELTVTLVEAGGQERELRRLLHNPAGDPSRRGHRYLRLLLPPDVKSGSLLRISSGPGPYGDEAWDWLYISHVGFVRSADFHPRQFPAFNRPPDEISAPLASISGGYGNPELLLHAPARLRFRLAGHERTLQFTYGFKSGAFNGKEKTEGAKFRVTATAPGLTPQVLFERTLRPATNRADRPEQAADLAVPALPAGTWLEIEIDPDGSNAWDWTYLSSLRLG